MTTSPLLVHGYIREQTSSLLAIIPKPIYTIVLRYSRSMIFHFDGENEEIFEISNDGQTVDIKLSNTHGTIRFGSFFSAKEKIKYRVHIKLEANCRTHCCGFGFLTPEFTDYACKGFNQGKNHSTMVGISGLFKHSQEFTYDDSKDFKHLEVAGHLINWCKENETVAIEVDMHLKIGKMWSISQHFSCENSEKVFEVGLPDTVAMFVYGGSVAQKFTVVHQQCLA